VGTLDSLVSLSDDLAKHDALAESVTRKVAQCLADVIDTDKKVWNKIDVSVKSKMNKIIYTHIASMNSKCRVKSMCLLFGLV
jgi:SMC interacting uncharacterized protein involved in chromosome segregation